MDQYQGWPIYDKSKMILSKRHSMALFGHTQYCLLFLHFVEVLRFIKYDQLYPEELFSFYLSSVASLKWKLCSFHD